MVLSFQNLLNRRKNARAAAAKRALRPLVVLGSSVTEQFDYIFGGHPEYHPFWASGWMARSLIDPRIENYLAEIMAPVPRHANVFLSFGSMDINFAAQRIARVRGTYDPVRFLQTTVDVIVRARETLLGLGFDQVQAVFIAPIVELPDSYWRGLSIETQLSTEIRAVMNYDLARSVGREIPTLNLLDEMVISPKMPFAKPALVRSECEHHVDYIAAQDIVWNGIKNVEGMLPRRTPRHDMLYPHTTHWIKDLREGGIPRPRTCH